MEQQQQQQQQQREMYVNHPEMISFSNLVFTHEEWSRIHHIQKCWLLKGTWVKDNVAKNESQPFKKICYPKNADRYCGGDCSFDSKVMEKPKFHWAVPDSVCDAPYEIYDKAKMLSYFKNKNLFVIGDSLNEQFYNTLMSSLNSADTCEVCTHFCKGDDVIEVRGMENEVVMNASSIRNDAFHYGEWKDTTDFFNFDFYTPFVKNNISFVIFNTGAHYRPDDVLLDDVNTTLTFLFEHHPQLTVVYRSTTAGHGEWGDKLLSDPLTELPVVHDTWGWPKFHHQNSLVKSFTFINIFEYI